MSTATETKILTDRNEILTFVADLIEFHPEVYDQGQWGQDDEDPTEVEWHDATVACGTKACIAGHVVAAAGYHPTKNLFNGKVIQTWGRVSKEKGVDYDNRRSTHDVSTLAAELLGLNDEDADTLFAEWWEPVTTVPEALRAIRDGIPVEAVTA